MGLGQTPEIPDEQPPDVDQRVIAEEYVLSQSPSDALVQAQIDAINGLADMRRNYARVAFVAMAIWLVFVGVLVVCTGSPNSQFELSDTVLVSLVAGATGNVIGLVGSVMWSLFPKSGIDLLVKSQSGATPVNDM